MIFKSKNIDKFIKDINIPIANASIHNGIKQGLLTINDYKDLLEINLSFVLPKPELVQLKEDISTCLKSAGIEKSINIYYDIKSRKTQPNLEPLKYIKNIIAVTAGKGGVGKSTVSVNLAAALAKMGVRVGLLDADIYGPNQPQLCGIDLKQANLKTENNFFIPIEKHNFKHISIGYLIDADKPAIWRGPMATKALSQLCFQTNWGELDYLIIDMPPGTGDIPLTLAQKIPVAGSVIVATPQSLALSDIDKSMAMLQKLKIPMLGIIENMGMYQCHSCGVVQSIFSQKHSQALCARFDKPLLAQIPLAQSIDEASEQGIPSVLQSDNAIAQIFEQVASKISIEIASQPRDYRVQFPKIVTE